MEEKLRILAASDLHGDLDVAIKLSKKAFKNNVDLVILAGDIQGYSHEDPQIFEPFIKANQKLLFIPGNIDSSREHDFLREKGKSIHDYYVTYKGVGIIGFGNENWKLRLDDGDFEKIKKNFEKIGTEKKIFVSHLAAEGTKAEFSGVPGDQVIRSAVEEFKPDILIAGHIHEAEGLEDLIGKTKVFQVGRKGKIIEI